MSLDQLYADDIEAGIQRRLVKPGPGPGVDFRTSSFLAAGMRGIPAAGLEVLGTAFDIGGLTQDTNLYLGPKGGPPVPMAGFSLAGGDTLRARASDMAPDAATSHVADQVLFGFTRVGAKVLAANAVAGPMGAAALLFGEGTNTAYRNLKAKGIDDETALKVGAVEGAGQAAAMLPIVGPTIKATAGLGLVAGPGTFMAQEALSRRILAEAGYQNEASRHDPLDPVGLGIATLLPGVFGGLHAVGLARAAKPAPTLASVVESLESRGQRYGSDGKLLTSPKGAEGEMQVMPGTARDPGFGVKPAADNSPEELARVGRDYLEAMHTRYGEPDQALAAYNAGPGAVDKAMATHGADWLAHLPQETQAYVKSGMTRLGNDTVAHAASDPAAIDAARVRTTQDALMRSMPDEIEAPAMVMRAADQVAAGEMLLMPETIARNTNRAVPAMDSASGKPFNDLSPDANNGKVTVKLSNQMLGEGEAFVRQIESLAEQHGTVYIRWSPTAERDLTGLQQSRDFVAGTVHDGLSAVAVTADTHHLDIANSLATYGFLRMQDQASRPRVYIGERVGTDSDSHALIKPTSAVLEVPDSIVRAIDLGLDKALNLVEDIRTLEKRLTKITDQGAASIVETSLEQKRAALKELTATSELSSPYSLGEPLPRSAGTNALPPQDSVTIVPEPAAKPAAEKADAPTPESQRATQLAVDTPDMLVTLPGSDTPVKLAEALRLAREQHARDLGETNLVKAALECALSFGA